MQPGALYFILCSLLAANSQISVPIDQKMQLTGRDYGNDKRNAIYVEQNVLIWVALLFIPYTAVLLWHEEKTVQTGYKMSEVPNNLTP